MSDSDARRAARIVARDARCWELMAEASGMEVLKSGEVICLRPRTAPICTPLDPIPIQLRAVAEATQARKKLAEDTEKMVAEARRQAVVENYVERGIRRCLDESLALATAGETKACVLLEGHNSNMDPEEFEHRVVDRVVTVLRTEGWDAKAWNWCHVEMRW